MVSVLGGAGNVVNIVTFVAMGVGESMAVFFLVLAVFDLSYLLAMFFVAVCYMFSWLEKSSQYRLWFPVDADGVAAFCAHVGTILYTMTILATTYMGVVRCLGVVKPMHFRNGLTRNLTLSVFFVFFLFALLSYIPMLPFIVMWVSPLREKVKDIIWLVRDAILPFAAQVIVFTCALVMSVYLKAAANFRSANTTAVSHDQSQNSSQNNTEDIKWKENKRLLKRSPNLSRKDVHVIQQLVLVCLVFVVFNTPRVVFSLASLAEDELSLGGVYQYIYITASSVMFVSQALNSSLNIFIYYHYSSSYRRHLLAITSSSTTTTATATDGTCWP
ncbi:uncharacterized protein LOC131930552 [Physella acuta]|uniref:uncharacterized protein LOC131930552 n=1 Tax=Physella acuta TaxID=109671 RepID=UPI0027DAF605|nr:uncharacterized protein LOC131930552 [Physella acuta]